MFAVHSDKKLGKGGGGGGGGASGDAGDTADSRHVALVHDVGTWKMTPLPNNYRLRYICEKGASSGD